MSKSICQHCVAEVQLFKRCRNLSAGTVLQRCSCLSSCLSSVATYLPALCCSCLSGVETYLPPLRAGWAELDILHYFYFMTDQVKPGHMQLLLLRSAFFFLLREIYSVRMSTSEFGSIISLNMESLHLISVDPI